MVNDSDMKTLQLSIIGAMVIIALGYNTSFGAIVAKTPEDLYRESDVILIGKIIIAQGNTEQRVTDYTIIVEKYLKNDLNEQTLQITSSGCRVCNLQVEDEPIFDTGDRVLLYLNSDGSTYQISPYSTVLVDDARYADLSKRPEGVAFYGKLIPQLIIVGTASCAAAVTGIIVYHKTRKKMNKIYVIIGAVIVAIGFIGLFITDSDYDEQIKRAFGQYFAIWIAMALAGIPVIISGFVKKFHIVFAIISSIALVLIWFQTFRTG